MVDISLHSYSWLDCSLWRWLSSLLGTLSSCYQDILVSMSYNIKEYIYDYTRTCVRLTANKRLRKKWLNPIWCNVDLLWLVYFLHFSTHSLFSAVFQELFNILFSHGGQSRPEKCSLSIIWIL